MPNYIKQIKVGESNYDLNVLAIQDNSGNPKTWTDITSLVQAGFTIEVPWTAADYASTSAPSAEKRATVPAVTIYYKNGAASTTGTLSANEEDPGSSEVKQHIYLIYHAGHEEGTDAFDEYVSAGSGSSSTWEKIGNTDIDLSPYAKKVDAAAKGTYASGGPSSNVTSAAGAATITTSSSGGQTATGTATITYDKAATATGSSGGTGTAANTGEAGGATVQGSNFSFSGTTATITLTGDYQPEGSITGSQSVSAHSHTVNVATGDATVVTGFEDTATSFSGDHRHDIETHTHNSAETVIKSTGLATATISAFSSGGSASLTTKNYGFASSVSNAMYSPTVSTLGVLSWSLANATTQDALTFTPASGTTKTVVTGVKSDGTASVAGTPIAATLQTSSAGSHDHTINALTATLTYVTGATLSTAGAHTINGSNFGFSGTSATISVSGSYKPAGSITGSQTIAAHSHSYTAPAAHTHSISLTTTTITAGVEVAVSDHTHTVTIASHTHDLGNHTHSTTIPAIDPGA